MSDDIPRTFCELFDRTEFGAVEIPIIQRDYAQGRSSAVEVREQFVDALYRALAGPDGGEPEPLDLDFVYGSVEEGQAGDVFFPLDGQQRLTTLFLLHWYLACKDGRLDAFREMIGRDERARFTYRIRPSSEDFCDALVNASFTLPAPSGDSEPVVGVLSQAIRDAPWYFLAWEQDPTVASALAVLDTIHTRFLQTNGLYERLTDRDNPTITFQFLNLRDFGLSDELYIKMNARGKPLTPFEALKARLEQKANMLLPGTEFELHGHMVSPSEYFGHRVDSAWADLFWHYREGDTRTFDRQFMNFARGLVTVTFPHGSGGSEPRRIDEVMRRLTDYAEEYSFFRYDADGCLTPYFTEMLIGVLDGLSGSGSGLGTFLPDSAYYDEEGMFRRVLRREPTGRLGSRGLVQSEWVQFYGYCSYLVRHQPTSGDAGLYEWVRVVSNLATNTIYSHIREFGRALVGVRGLLDAVGSSSLLGYVADVDNPIRGFNQQQIREERLKAQLMDRDKRWRDLILTAEKHGYFRGQIEFLLDFCGVLDRWLELGSCDWDDGEDEKTRQAFSVYLDKACAVFGDNGLRTFRDCLWERALLSVGDYTLQRGSNWSFLDDGDRDASWKRLLRSSEERSDSAQQNRDMVRDLLDRMDLGDIEESLQSVIDEYLAGDDTPEGDWWRSTLVACPAAIDFCEKRCFRYDYHEEGGWSQVYLLSKERMSSYHVDLLTYALHDRLLTKGGLGAIPQLGESTYWMTRTESEEPRAQMADGESGVVVRVTNSDGEAELAVSHPGGKLDWVGVADLEALFGAGREQDGDFVVSLAAKAIDEAIDRLEAWLGSNTLACSDDDQ